MSTWPCLLSWREHYPAGSCGREQILWLLPEQARCGNPTAMAVEVGSLLVDRISDARLRVLDSHSGQPE